LAKLKKDLRTKFKGQFNKELTQINEAIQKSSFNLSNLVLVLEMCSNMPWNYQKKALGNLEEKRRV
jgi:mRNA-degrading endonuclease YafQ of YafQ-DinJ toxin-antitoxin module